MSKCCSCDCDQGRECPFRKQAEANKSNSIDSITIFAVVVFIGVIAAAVLGRFN